MQLDDNNTSTFSLEDKQVDNFMPEGEISIPQETFSIVEKPFGGNLKVTEDIKHPQSNTAVEINGTINTAGSKTEKEQEQIDVIRKDLKSVSPKEDSYYLEPEQTDALRMELQSISPERNARYQEVQQKASLAFIELYGAFLTEDQRKYLLSSNVIVTDNFDFMEDNVWLNNESMNRDRETGSLNGKLYTDYKIESSHFESGSSAENTPVGEVPFVIEGEDEGQKPISSELLRSENEKHDSKNPLKALNQLRERINFKSNSEYTRYLAAIVLHEKIHGVQKADLPLPLLEIAANYYQQETFIENNWDFRKVEFFKAFEKSREYWQTLVDKYGEDVHRWMFGNLPQERFEEITSTIKSEFNEETFNSMFESNEYTPGIKWYADERSLEPKPQLP